MFIDDQALKFERQLKDLGGVMDFAVYHLLPNTIVTEDVHKAVLAELFNKVIQQMQIWQEDFLKRYPHYKDNQFIELYYDLAKAIATPFTKEEIIALGQYKNWRQGKAALFAAFYNPPYSTKMEEGEGVEKFNTWCRLLGLNENEDIVVLDWVGNPDADPQRSDWSNYFNEGKEWWGIWCLTIYNPKHNSLSAVMASATD